MKIWGKIAITCLIVVGITANMENKAISTTAASVFWISLIIGLVQKFKNKNKTKNLPKQEKTSAIKQEKPKKKKIQNICWKCQHKYMSDGWYNWWMGICPKCGANSTGHYLLVGIITVALISVFACQPKKDTQKPQEQTITEQKKQEKTDEMPYYVDKNYTIIKSFPACLTRELYTEFVESDYKNRVYLIDKGVCVMTKTGLKISVIDRSKFTTRGIRIFLPKIKDATVAYTGVEFVVPDPNSK